MELPQLVIHASIVYQHDGGVILMTSQLSSFVMSPKFNPDDAILMKIDDKD